MENLRDRDYAAAKFNGDFFCIESLAHHRSQQQDPQGKQLFFAPDASDDALGAATLDALAHSRFIPLDQLAAWPLDNRPKYEAWVQNLVDRYGYKTRRALFRHMRHCGIRRKDGRITIHPSNHDSLEGWQGIKDEEVAVPADSSAQEIGAALRLAFSRCT
jgi:hypothetical protein